jgi:hypothetical protein
MRFAIEDVPTAFFWQRVDVGPGCWNWRGFLDGKGYGRVTMRRAGGGKISEGAHRIAWALENGPIPEGGHVLHNCNNPACVNSAHLRIGSHADNMNDLRLSGRRKGKNCGGGERAGNHKLTAAQVAEARCRHAGGETNLAIAADLGVCPSTISHVVHNKTWRDDDHTDGREREGGSVLPSAA